MNTSDKNMTQQVYDEVSSTIADQNVRELWHRLRSELTRSGGGPDACLTYLESELMRFKEQTRRALDWLS